MWSYFCLAVEAKEVHPRKVCSSFVLAPLVKGDSTLGSLEDRRSARHFGANPCSSLYEHKIRGMVSLKVPHEEHIGRRMCMVDPMSQWAWWAEGTMRTLILASWLGHWALWCVEPGSYERWSYEYECLDAKDPPHHGLGNLMHITHLMQ